MTIKHIQCITTLSTICTRNTFFTRRTVLNDRLGVYFKVKSQLDLFINYLGPCLRASPIGTCQFTLGFIFVHVVRRVLNE